MWPGGINSLRSFFIFYPNMPNTKKNKKPKLSKLLHPFWVSKEKRCLHAHLLSDKDNSCNLPSSEVPDINYVIVYNQKHLYEKKYACGCVVYRNDHYPEFDIPDLIWHDFFGVKLEDGKKNIKFTLTSF